MPGLRILLLNNIWRVFYNTMDNTHTNTNTNSHTNTYSNSNFNVPTCWNIYCLGFSML